MKIFNFLVIFEKSAREAGKFGGASFFWADNLSTNSDKNIMRPAGEDPLGFFMVDGTVPSIDADDFSGQHAS